MPEATPSPAAPVLVADRLGDFSDRLPAMLVKELRQGLRAKTFVIVFLTVQIILGLVLLGSLGASRHSQDAGHFISSTIFLLFSYATLVIQPVRGIGTLHREIRDHTIELMVLTRLTAWRIVLGKWVSLVSQSALLLAAIVPYLILRYFFGDMNLFGELMLLGLVFLASTVLTAIIVGISCVPSVLLRGLVPLIGAGVLFWVIPQLCFDNEFEDLIEFASIPNLRTFWVLVIVVAMGLYAGWTALGLGASLIAPVAENHSSIRRWVVLALLALITFTAALFEPPVGALVTFVLVVLVPSLVMDLTEPFQLVAPVCRPFLKRGILGRAAGRFLYPGWPSGVLFSFVAIALGALGIALAVRSRAFFDRDDVIPLFGLLGTLLMPAALLSVFGRRVRQRFVVYLLLLVGLGVLTGIVGFIADASRPGSTGFLWFFPWLPFVHAFMLGQGPQFDTQTILVSVLSVTACYAMVLLATALLQFRRIREIEDEALASNRSD